MPRRQKKPETPPFPAILGRAFVRSSWSSWCIKAQEVASTALHKAVEYA